MVDKVCKAESKPGQQPYNICIGQAEERADNDFAIFYNNLQMLCHDQDQLATLQASEKAWQIYRDTIVKATHASLAKRDRRTGICWRSAPVVGARSHARVARNLRPEYRTIVLLQALVVTSLFAPDCVLLSVAGNGLS